ncbi:helicase/relaxase domain-containing protein [Halomonas pacifica]|uniref:DNA-binding domain-containing protein n=1 Tax=Halomonas sulfidivorans TaxID=2733488 RepID=A0ABX7WD42_9GAMM|nr:MULTISPECIES: MobH family relaxase [Halomonas]MDC8802663.1 helicase/relaxase domain-containing protein [Halomonas pacifica]QTP58225.1 DNA-binding domain-containing protein [Halomonas sulfidivorans]
MLILNFLRGRRGSTDAGSVQGDADWETPRTGAELLATPYRQQLLKAIQESTSLTQPVFDAYVKEPVQRYAERIQLLPASESHHHSYPGGMLDHGLETCVFGLRLRRQHLLPPKESPEKQSSTGELWSVAVIYACLLHDIAKAIVDIDIHLKSGRRWCLWEGVIPDRYRVRYVKGRDYFLHSATNLLLCKEVVGNSGLEWLRSQPDLFGLVMYTVSGHSERSGVIGEIVSQADRASVAKSLGGKVSNIDKPPRESLQSKLKGAICHIVTEKIRLNEKGAQGFVTSEALWLVTPLVPREIKSYLLSHGIEGVPTNESRLYDEMQSHGLIMENPEGRSVWKCVVEMGEWRTDLFMLKVHKSLVWNGDEEPEVFSGNVEAIEGDGNKPADRKEIKEPEPDDVPASVETLSELTDSSSVEKIQDDLKASILDIATGGDEKAEPSLEEQPGQGPAESDEGVAHHASSGQTSPGKDFLAWLRDGLKTHKILMNDSKALVHAVDGTLFIVSPKVFKRYCQEVNREEKEWKEVQDSFQKLKLHKKNKDGGSFHKVKVIGPNKKSSTLSGYLVGKDDLMERGKEVFDNPFIDLIDGKPEE